MKIAIVAAAALCGGTFLLYEVVSLRGEIDTLREERAAAPSPAPDGATLARLGTLETRFAKLEQASQAARPSSPDPAAPDGAKLDAVQSKLAAHEEEIAALRKDLDGVRKVRGALDEGADKILSALGQGPAAGEGGGGLSRLAELGALWRKSPEELTPEEKAQRDQMAGQVREKMTDWAIQGFDRTLEEKMSEPQKADIRLALDDERTALDDLRNQNLTDAERETRRTEIRARTDQRAEKILTPKQFESYKSYRARTGRGGLGELLRGGRGGRAGGGGQ